LMNPETHYADQGFNKVNQLNNIDS